MNLHIYRAAMQPATAYVDRCGPHDLHGGWPPEKWIAAHCCGVRHRAANLVVQCYYDGMSIYCAPDKGCNDPRLIRAKANRTFRRRSEGQKRRWHKDQK